VLGARMLRQVSCLEILSILLDGQVCCYSLRVEEFQTNVLTLDGVSWLLGLLQGGLGLTGYDAVAHMIEELVRLHRQENMSTNTL